MRRLFLLAWSSGPLAPHRVGAIKQLAKSQQLDVIVDRPTLILVADPALPALPVPPDGLVLGTLVDRGGKAPLATLDREDAEAIARTRGSMLCSRYWGSYLALLPDQDGALDLIRGPFGDLGVCVVRDGLGWLVAADAALLAAVAERRPAIDGEALARHLAVPELVGAETCLGGVTDLRGGDRLTLRGNNATTTNLWSPWQRALAPPARDRIEAARALRNAVSWSVTASAASYDRTLLFLSGGLDSSIVASALAEGGHRWSGLNMVTPDPIGDEREYARATAHHLGGSLHEALRDPAGIDFHRSLAARLPRPMTRAFNQESERLAFLEAERVGATALMDGSGGDNVFCSHRSVAATADCLLTGGYNATYCATADALASLTGASLPRILFQSVRRAWLRPAAREWKLDTRYLAPRFAAVARSRDAHSWYVPPAGALPGRSVHVSLLAAAQALVESGSAVLPIDRVSPLVSQPVAEACLSAPNWMWFAPGHDRALARQAFVGALPRLVINRRSKGTPSPFIADILDKRRAEVRPFLLDGVLSSMRLLDVDALRRQLDDPAPAGVDQFPRLLGLIDAEAWARCWA